MTGHRTATSPRWQQVRFDVEAYIVPVDFGCAGLHTVQVGASPDDLGDGSR